MAETEHILRASEGRDFGSLSLNEQREEVLATLCTCELDSTPLIHKDMSLPGRLFVDARSGIKDIEALVRQASEEQGEATKATREALEHMRRVSPKKRKDQEAEPEVVVISVKSAGQKLSHVERLLAMGADPHEVMNILTQVKEMYDEFEPALQDVPSTCLEAAIACQQLGVLSSGQAKFMQAENLYFEALELLNKADDDHSESKREVTAKLILNSLCMVEDFDDETDAIKHSDADHEDKLKSLICDAEYMLGIPGAPTPNELLLTESIAKAKISLGKIESAQEDCEQAIGLAKQLYMEREPQTVASVLARMAAVLGDSTQGFQYAEEALEILKQIPELQNEVATLVQCSAVASNYVDQGRLEEAHQILEKTAPQLVGALGATHISVAYLFRDHAEVCFAQGKRLEAKKLFKQAYEAMDANRDCFGEDDMLRCYNGMKMYIEVPEIL